MSPRRQTPRTDWPSRLPLWLALAFLLVFVLVPLGGLLVQTFAGPQGFTTEAWAALLADENLLTQVVASLRLGVVATALSLLLGFGHAWLTTARDLPAARWLGPLGVAPLVMPPIFVAMGFTDVFPASGFWPCAILLGVAHAPFVAVLAARGLRAVDGRAYEAALLLRGQGRAELWLLRAILPELLAGCLLAFVFTVSEYGVPEFLTVKGKTWHTYAEGILGRWTRRAVGTTFAEVQSPIVAGVPFLVGLMCLLWAALRLRASSPDRGVPRPLPLRPLGGWRWPALLVPTLYLGLGIALPVVVLARWALGSTQRLEPMSLQIARQSFQKAMDQGLTPLLNSLALASCTALAIVLLALPLARAAARRRPSLDLLAALPMAVPSILLGIALVRSFHDAPLLRQFGSRFDQTWAFSGCAYVARFLPFAALSLSSAARRLPVAAEEAGQLVPRPPFVRALRLHIAPLLPATWSAFVLAFVLALRELDLAAVLAAANNTAVRRLGNAVHWQNEDWTGVIGLLLVSIAVLVPLVPAVLAGRRLSSLS